MDLNDDIVISGIAGRYPDCGSVEELKDALLSGKDLVTIDSRRFPPGHMGTPLRAGKVNGLEFFDATYFNVSHKQADHTDPRQRMIQEVVYESLLDAGINPKELKGTRTGVFTACAPFDNHEQVRKNPDTSGYTNIGFNTSICANRISYSFDFKGLSYAMDTACSSGMYALSHGLNAIRSGDCDYAVVAGVHLCFHPYDTLEFFKLNMLSEDGKCKVFSDVRDGYVRSEAIVSMILQRKTGARRIYSTVLGAKTNSDGFKPEGLTYPSTKMQTELIKQVLEEANVNPLDIKYIEAHGTGTTVGDIQECQSILNSFCKDRKDPLLLGAIKSNMGHSEVSSGLCSLSKVIIAMETGIIPANLHFNAPGQDIPGINDGRLKVVDKNTPWKGGIVAANSFGFGGANAHIILKSNNREKVKTTQKLSHRLVQVSGRTKEAVDFFLDSIKKHQDDQEFLALIDEIHKTSDDGHNYRGYQIFGENPEREVERCVSENRPIWFVYSGMGSQWPAMGKDLMKFEVFRKTIKRCANALKPYNIDLEDSIVNGTNETFDNICNCFTAIAAIEIALTDLLASLGIKPDGFCGHSLGEVGCAYADGHLEPEQAVLLAFARGYASVNSKLPRGQMAAIGMEKEACQKILPPNVSIACYNSKTSITISGEEEEVKNFVAEQSAKGVFAKLVNSANYAYHSKYVQAAGPIMLEFLKKVIPDPKLRSSKWISSSNVESKWDTDLAKYNSAEYHQNNFLNPVLFDQVYKYIPENAILIEIAPHGLLQAIVKRELPSTVSNVSLVNRTSKDNYQFLLAALGKIYNSGGQPNLRKLYNSVTFPVSRGTPMVGHMVKWDHSVKFNVPLHEISDSFGEIVTVNISEPEDAYMEGHTIDGRVLLPATGYLFLVWELLANMLMKPINEVAVMFENVKFQRATVLPPDTKIFFLVNIMKQSGHFEMFESGSIVVTGKITVPKDISEEFFNPKVPKSTEGNGYLKLTTNDVYKELNLRRYAYTGLFSGIKECDVEGVHGILNWNDNWTSFLDTMMQMTLFKNSDRGLHLPVGIQKVIIDPKKHLADLNQNTKEIPVFVNKNLNIVKSGGVELIGMEASKAPRRQKTQIEPTLESYEFIPFESKVKELNVELALKIALGTILENNDGVRNLIIANVVGRKEDTLQPILTKLTEEEPLSNAEILDFDPNSSSSYDVIALNEISIEEFASEVILKKLKKNGFILYEGPFPIIEAFKLQTVYSQATENSGIYLLREPYIVPASPVKISVSNSNLGWIEQLQTAIKVKDQQVIYLIGQDEYSGLAGFMKCMFNEPGGNLIRCVLVEDKNIEEFSLDSVFYKRQLSKNLTINIFKNNAWGSYRHLPLAELEFKEVTHACSNIMTIGDLSSFKWIQRPSNYHENVINKFCTVYYAALNFKDVMTATGKLQNPFMNDPTSKELAIGVEFSGLSKDSKKIMGITQAVAVSLYIENYQDYFVWTAPDSWTLAEAATIPVVYGTSYYALCIRGQMKPDHSVLIHSGTGGIGMASIYIALSMGCTIFTTVSSEEKKQFLLKTFPQLDPNNIGNSRNGTFENMIMENTNGRGVDLVLNSLAADLFQASLRCVATHGRFLEIGKADFFNGTLINSKLFLKNCTFHGVLLDSLYNNFHEDKILVQKLVQEGIEKGVVRPLPKTIFQENQVEEAFRYLATGKHKGKVLIQIRDETKDPSIEGPKKISALPIVYFDPEKVYILIGGMGGFGLELADWLIERGAMKIILNSRRNVVNGYQSYCIKKWKEWNMNIIVNTDDTSTLKGAEALIAKAKAIGEVGGVFNMALVLKDAIFENQTVENYMEVFKSKIISGFNMDILTRKHCPTLDYFIVFSSIASGRGNAGQTNYAMANSALERLCDKRKKDNLHGLAIQWGPVADVGYLANIGMQNEVIFGMVPQNITSCLNTLDRFILQPCSIVATTVLAAKEESSDLIVGKTPVQAVAHILGIKNVELIEENTTLSQLGLDSLMSTEIKQTLYRNYNIELEVDDIRNLTFKAIENFGSDPNKEDATENIPGPLTIFPEEIVVNLQKPDCKKNIFFMHPIEGHIEFMKPLAAKVQANIYGLQSTSEVNFKKIQEYASLFIKYIKNIQPKGPYYLCAYSFGCTVAIEMALQLEALKETVSIFCIDGSPNFVRDRIFVEFGKYDETNQNQKQNIKKFTKLFPTINYETAVGILDKKLTFEQYMDEVCDVLINSSNFESNVVASAALGYYKRCFAGSTYTPSGKIKGQVVLIRSTTICQSLSDDYDLNLICEVPVPVYKLKGEHLEMLLGNNLVETANIINKYIIDVQ